MDEQVDLPKSEKEIMKNSKNVPLQYTFEYLDRRASMEGITKKEVLQRHHRKNIEEARDNAVPVLIGWEVDKQSEYETVAEVMALLMYLE